MPCTSQDITAMVQYDIQIQAGVRFDESNLYFIRKVNGVAESLYGWTAEFEIRNSINGGLCFASSTDDGGVVLDVIPGSVYIRLTDEQTSTLEPKNGKGVYLLKLISPVLEPTWFAWGNVTVSRWGQ